MIQMIDLLPADILAMGLAGRTKIELEFDEKIVIAGYLEVLKAIPSLRKKINCTSSDLI